MYNYKANKQKRDFHLKEIPFSIFLSDELLPQISNLISHILNSLVQTRNYRKAVTAVRTGIAGTVK